MNSVAIALLLQLIWVSMSATIQTLVCTKQVDQDLPFQGVSVHFQTNSCTIECNIDPIKNRMWCHKLLS